MKILSKLILFTLLSSVVISCSPDRLKPIRKLARSQNLEKKEEAALLYKEAVSTLVNAYSSSAGLNKTIGKQLLIKGAYEKALEHLEQSRDIINNDFETYHCIAICHVNLYKINRNKEHLIKAKENYKYALNISPDRPGVLYDYAQLLVFGTEEYQEAVNILTHYIYKLKTQDKNGYFLLGRSLFLLGEYDKAYEVYSSIYNFEKELTAEEKTSLDGFIAETLNKKR
ncbi:MAG: hypothetical protein J6B11_06680 [Spirochaetales bacterium]|nr:hypothetical protein [Spirochaetales bacterium]